MNESNGANMKDDSKRDDDFCQRTIGRLEDNVSPPNRDLMAAAIAAAAETFAGDEQQDDSTHVTLAKETSVMLTFVRPLAAIVATAAAIFIVVALSRGASANVNFGDVLDRLNKSQSLKLLIKQAENESEVLIAGDSVRWQDSDRRYRIARGSRLWQIDESNNTVSDSANPWSAGENQSIDLLALLGTKTTKPLRAVESSGQIQHAGTLCNVFLFQPDPATSDLAVRCFADAETNQLLTIGCWKPGVDPATAPPLAELRLVKRNFDFDEDLFVVGKGLSKDGRIGEITLTQGLVQIRPQAYQRWTPVAGRVVLKPGDWIRTDSHGANAATVQLTSGHRVIPGPGSMIEVTNPQTAVLHRGEANFSSGGAAEQPLTLSAGGKDSVLVQPGKTRHFIVDGDRKLVRRDDQPKWLAGFLGNSSEESIGSLITKIDGRDVPLTVGYHKVKVEIRDQIARTTIEESFVNHTDGRLEGQFHFPLPQDASISGFGMWINGELIEADVVEKQRAREIYETILRERRDPGLLEWAGGNVFKARVFPIEPHSEKRIKIVYTQVLPMRANKYRYSYALRSEMLQKTPLRELAIDVQVSSALRLKSVTCPTHTVRTDLTAHAASTEFSAQQFTPKRDFEIVCEVDQQESDVVVVPHQRGDEGYFLAQITPPSAEGNWQRDILPNGDPVNVMLVCDTSGSMDRQTRKTQREFVAAVLSALGDEDRFNIASCDVDTAWFSGKQVAADAQSMANVTKWLDDRASLGWTDLDRMAEVVLKQLQSQPEGQRTHVIYIGDGIATARDANPQACAGRLRQALADVKAATFHCVSIGSRFESGVLQALASVGGGSVRQIDGQQTSQRTALELLNEVMQPGLTDIKIEFRGIEVAAVYPQRLPNLAAGTQQIIVGRYLPAGENQSGELVISGNRNGQPVRYASRIKLDNAESGNSFIPRLWARGHLDYLLEQGSNQFVQDDVIALSEEFHIMTPYTSLLVLETDADRERFGVKRRFQMRDGEQFFADGRSKASFELLQKQMKAAGNWRLELRRQVLRELASLGRVRLTISAQSNYPLSHLEEFKTPYLRFSTIFDEDRRGGFRRDGEDLRRSEEVTEWTWNSNREISDYDALDKLLVVEGLSKERPQDALAPSFPFETKQQPTLLFSDSSWLVDTEEETKSFIPSFFIPSTTVPLGLGFFRSDLVVTNRQGGQAGGRPGWPATAWIDQLVPHLAGPAAKTMPVESKWNDDINRLVDSLVSSVELTDGRGLEVSATHENFNVRWNRQSSHSTTQELTDGKRWLSAPVNIGSQNTIDWCDTKHRSNASRAWKIGRRRAATPTDVSEFQPGHRPWSGDSIVRSYRLWSAKINESGDADKGESVVTLTLTAPKKQGDRTVELTIDRKRNVVLEYKRFEDGKQVARSTYGDYVQAADLWWPQSTKDFDDQGRVTHTVSQSIKVLDQQKFAARFAELKPDETVYQIIDFPLSTVSDARAKVTGATAEFEDYLVLILDACRIQNWALAFEAFEKLTAIVPEKPCVKAIGRHLLVVARRNHEALESYRNELQRLADNENPEELFIAGQLLNMANGFADYNERLELLETAKPIYRRHPDHIASLQQWRQRQVSCLQGLNRDEEAIALQRKMAEAAPWQYSLHTSLAQNLSNAGDFEIGIQWLEKQIRLEGKWQTYERDEFYSTIANILSNNDQDVDLDKLLKRWMSTKTTSRRPYGQYLSTLIRLDQPAAANETAKRWLNESMRDAELPAWELVRLSAAIRHATGRGYNGYLKWMAPEWYKPLQEVAAFFLKHEHHYNVPNQFLVNSRYSPTEQAKHGRRLAADMLQQSAAQMQPAKLRSLIALLVSSEELSKDDWLAIATKLRQRWQEEADATDQRELGDLLAKIYSKHATPEEHVAFLQDRLKVASSDPAEAYRLRQLSDQLFAAILKQTWTDQVEDAAFDALSHSLGEDDAAASLAKRIDRLQQLVDAIKSGVFAVADAQLRSHGHPEKHTRQELAKLRSEMRQKALEHVVAKLFAEHKKQRNFRADEVNAGLHAEWLAWLKLEQMHFRVQAADDAADNLYDKGGDFEIVIQACREMMGSKPLATLVRDSIDADKEDKQTEKQRHWAIALSKFKQLRQERACTILSNLSLRKSAPDALASEVLGYIERGMKLPDADGVHWTNRYRMMLLALDRPEQLEQSLRKSLQTNNDPAPLQMTLARLLAEQGNIKEAIGLAEVAKKAAPLAPADLSALADWYLVADRPDDYRQARIDTFLMMEEYHISNWLRQRLQPWTRNDGPLPSELEQDVLFAFEALFKKSQSPARYCYQLREYYTACRDFRLLQMVPDAVVGRTPQQVYPFLTKLNSSVLSELRSEATMDKIVQRINELRETKEKTKAKTDGKASTTDLRALDLLETMVRRKAAEVLNQPGPHEQAALAAMRRAFERDWAPGERLQMAKFLKDMGSIENQKLAAEQLRELRELHSQATAGSDSHFRMSWHFAEVLSWNKQQERAIRVMEAALRQYHETNKPGLPVRLNTPFAGYVGLLETKNRFAAAEKLLLAELDQVRNRAQMIWLRKRLNNSRVNAYKQGAQISLGQGKKLYRNLLDSLLDEAGQLDERYRYEVLEHIVSVLWYKSQRDEATVQEDLRKYAFEQFPKLVKPIDSNYSNSIDRVADLVHEEMGPLEGDKFLVERLENYPARYQATYQSGWQQLSYDLANWRSKAKKLGPLEGRVLKLVLDNLRVGLVVRDHLNDPMMSKHNSYFWKEKETDFARVADEVAAEHKNSAIVVQRVARYLFDRLNHQDRAIELMQDAQKRELLSEEQELSLVYMLRDRKRWAEAAILLESWVIKKPGNILYRSLLIKALSLSGQLGKRDKMLADTEEYFRQENRWTEGNLAMLADHVYQAKMYKVAVRLYDELIPMHQRGRPNQSAQDNATRVFLQQHGGTNRLSNYYQNLARSHAELGDTIAAVDAAAGGIVARGQNQSQRVSATQVLQQLIRDSKDLDGLLAHLDQQAESTGQDSAIIRKAVGTVLLELNQSDKAISQLQLAVDLQPTDGETHQKLIEAYDKADRKDDGTEQMLTQLDFDRHNLELYKQLAKRLKADDSQAERAATSLIEAAPLEASHHQALAELRQDQDRWDDAIDHWREVAELRKLEPTGLVKLAEAQIHLQQWDDAAATVENLQQREWPERFRNVKRQISKIQKRIRKRKRK